MVVLTPQTIALTPPAQPDRWVEVLVDCPGAEGLFTYRVPTDLTVQPGDILSVPFGAQQVGGVAVRLLQERPSDLQAEQLRSVEDRVCEGFFNPTYWQLLQTVAEYYATPLMQVIRTALPPGLLGRGQRRVRLKPDANGKRSPTALSPVAQQVLQVLQGSKQQDYSWQHLQRQVKAAHRGLRELIQLGWAENYLEPPHHTRPKQRQAVILVTVDRPSVPLTEKQQAVVTTLQRLGGEAWLSDLLQRCDVNSSVVKALEKKAIVVTQAREVLRSPVDHLRTTPDTPKTLTPPQAEALSTITALSGNAQVLLHGVTGSGKTEVYLQAIAPILKSGRSALVLVPEIGLTPQLTDRFRARFGDRVCIYHSALSDGERYDTWRQMLSGTPQVVIGTRSAIFAPLPQLGLIILDEEHDSSFKQDSPAPCYHARTVAQWRSQLEQCPLILGSATPSLETWVAVSNPQPAADHDPPSIYLSLPDRIHNRPMPPIEVVDMRQELAAGNRSIFSRSLHRALSQLKTQGQQGILFIHRRGHSTFVSCRSCGMVMDCPNCDVSLAYHQTHAEAQSLLRCHYCNHTERQPDRCPECQSPYLKHFGSGTQRVAQGLAEEFPELRALRFDSDTTRTKGAHRALLTRFAEGEAELLIGTQMLTKGIDLPQVTLVGVVAADGLLYLSDFRASERAFQTLTQVAGRSGRGDDPGQVIIQTYSPQHPVIRAVQQHEFQSFMELEFQQRSMLHYPPMSRLILLRFSGSELPMVQRAAEEIARILAPGTTTGMGTGMGMGMTAGNYDLLGPAPAQVMRVARRFRWQILLRFPLGERIALPVTLTELKQLCPVGVSLTIDIDPLNLL